MASSGSVSGSNIINHSSTIYGGQTNNFSDRKPRKPINPTREKPCISPSSLSPVSTYVSRPALSKDIRSKMQKPCGNKSLSHALAVTGLGGTGKTQLVLQYIEEQKHDYDTILWIDAQDETALRSSFARSSNALSITFEREKTPSPLHDSPVVQNVLDWLASRGKNQSWLVVFDNADDTLDQLSFFIPRNHVAGNVIITSQDGKAAKLFPGANLKALMIDKMEIEEAKTLLALRVGTELRDASWEVMSLLEKIANRLDGIALAIDIAGARIRDDMDTGRGMCDTDDDLEGGESVVAALEQYIADLGRYKKRVVSDPAYNSTSSYQKTTWNVWETVLSSLERFEKSDEAISACPSHLLRLAALLGSEVTHRELFRSASQSLSKVCSQLAVQPPQWFMLLLKVSDDGQWNSFAYRDSLKPLIDFSLVRTAMEEVSNLVERRDLDDPSMVSWPGFTMHGLVRWRAEVEATQDEYKLCRALLVAASCRTNDAHENGIDSSFAMRGYLPQDASDWRRHLTKKGYADLCSMIGTTLLSLEEYGQAEALLERAHDLKSQVSGKFDPATVQTGVEHFTSKFLAKGMTMYRDAARSHDWPIPFQALPGARANFVAALHYYSRTRTPRVSNELAESKKAVGSRARYIASQKLVKKSDEEDHPVLLFQQQQLEALKKLLGDHDCAVVRLKSNLARWHGWDRAYKQEEKYLKDLLNHAHQTFGEEHPSTLQLVEKMAFCQLGMGHVSSAIHSMENLGNVSQRVLGWDDPRTISHKAHHDDFLNWQRLLQIVKPDKDEYIPSEENLAWLAQENIELAERYEQEGYDEQDRLVLDPENVFQINLALYEGIVRGAYTHMSARRYTQLEEALNSVHHFDRLRHLNLCVEDDTVGW